VICPQCQALSPQETRYCFQCGGSLSGSSENFAFSEAEAMEDPLARVPDMHWFLVLVYDIISFGIYSRVWFLRRMETFQHLRSWRRLNPGLLWASLFLKATSLAVSLAGRILFGEAPAIPVAGVPLDNLLEGLSSFLNIAALVLLIQQAFRLRRMLKDHLATQGREPSIPALWTLLFREVHLQHAINGIKAGRR